MDDMQELDVTVVRVGRDRLVLVGSPDDEETTPDGWHNCDYMGCGTDHVVARAIIVRADGDPETWNRGVAMLRALADQLGFAVVPKLGHGDKT